MRTIKLYGHLGKRFGREFKFDVKTPREAVAALRATVPGFAAYMMQHSAPGYHFMVDKRPLGPGQDLGHPCGAGTIKIIPAVVGAKNGGVFQTILGAVLVVAGVLITPYSGPLGSALSAAGVSMIAGGVIQMLTRTPGASNNEDPENMPSYAFNGPVNTTTQGNPVPVCYGEMVVGSQVVSFGLTVEDIYAATSADPTWLHDGYSN